MKSFIWLAPTVMSLSVLMSGVAIANDDARQGKKISRHQAADQPAAEERRRSHQLTTQQRHERRGHQSRDRRIDRRVNHSRDRRVNRRHVSNHHRVNRHRAHRRHGPNVRISLNSRPYYRHTVIHTTTPVIYSNISSGYYNSHADTVFADVVFVEPIVRYVTVNRSQRECWQEDVQTGGGYRSTAANTIAGGIVGGVVGRQFGDGKGRDAMTVLGTLVGSAIANDNASRRAYEPVRYQTVERCEMRPVSHQEERIDGYHVTYRYQGQEHTTRMSYDPGSSIQLRVQVSPLS